MTRKSNSLSTIKSSSYLCFLILPRDVETGENDQEATWLNYCCQIVVFGLIGRFVMDDVYWVYSRNWDLWLSLTCIERPQTDSTCQASAWMAAKVRVPRFWVKNPEKCDFHNFCGKFNLLSPTRYFDSCQIIILTQWHIIGCIIMG